MTTAVIVDAVRTPGGKGNGKLRNWVFFGELESSDQSCKSRLRRGARHVGSRALESSATQPVDTMDHVGPSGPTWMRLCLPFAAMRWPQWGSVARPGRLRTASASAW